MSKQYGGTLYFYELVILAGFASAHKSVIIPSLRSIMETFNVSYTYGGLLVGLYLFFTGLAALGWAVYSDYTGHPRKLLIFVGLLGGVLFTLISYWLTNPILFAFFYILGGMSISVVGPLSITIIMDLVELENRTSAIMMFSVFSGFGYVIGYGLGASLTAITGSWRYPIIIVIGLVVILGLPLSLILKEPPKGLSEKPLKHVLSRIHRYPFTLRPEDIQIIVGSKSNYYLTLQGIFGIIASGAIEVWLIQYLITEAGATEIIAVFFMGLGAIGSIVGIYLARVADILYKYSKKARPLVAGATSIVASFFAISFLMTPIYIGIKPNGITDLFVKLLALAMKNNTLLMAIIFLFLAMLFSAPIGSIKASIISEVNLPEHRATVISGISIIELFSKSIGMMIIGVLIDFFHSVRYPMMLAVAMWMVSGIFWYRSSYFVPKDSWKVNAALEERKSLLRASDE